MRSRTAAFLDRALRGWRPRFRLSTLLWLTLLAGVLVAWWCDHMRLKHMVYESLNPSPSWKAFQATGPPDTLRTGDIPTAWASATQDGQREWLELSYKRFLVPRRIHVYETYNPGALDRITAINPVGRELLLWQGQDPVALQNGIPVAIIPVHGGFKVNRLRIHLDSPAVPGWNEIDAVGIEDASGQIEWADSARASSTFGEPYRISRFGTGSGVLPPLPY